MSSRTQVLSTANFHPAVQFPASWASRTSASVGEEHTHQPDARHSLHLRVYLIEPDSGLRAKLARLILASGFHVEIFGNVAEFLSYAPGEGVIFVNDSIEARGVAGVIATLANARILMPVVAYRSRPSIDNVIAAMRARAANFLPIESFETGLREVLELAIIEVETGRDRRSRVNDAYNRLMCLSNRERQVLELIADGASNKEIARSLDISPRTVEIHRMKMMAKISARSSCEAVRIWCMVNSFN